MRETCLENFIFDHIRFANFFCHIVETQRGIILSTEDNWNVDKFYFVCKYFAEVSRGFVKIIAVSAAEIHKLLINNFFKTMCSRYIPNYIIVPLDGSFGRNRTRKDQPKDY